MKTTTAFKIGSKVKLTKRVDRFPHFLVNAGATGTVVEDLGVKLDETVKGAEEWDNVLYFYDMYESEMEEVLEVVPDLP